MKAASTKKILEILQWIIVSLSKRFQTKKLNNTRNVTENRLAQYNNIRVAQTSKNSPTLTG